MVKALSATPSSRGVQQASVQTICAENSLHVADAVGDILKGLIAQDLSKTPDAVNDMLKGLLRAADFTTAPNLSGLADGPRSTKYFPKIWEAAPPERGWMDPIGNAAEKLKVRFARQVSILQV